MGAVFGQGIVACEGSDLNAFAMGNAFVVSIDLDAHKPFVDERLERVFTRHPEASKGLCGLSEVSQCVCGVCGLDPHVVAVLSIEFQRAVP